MRHIVNSKIQSVHLLDEESEECELEDEDKIHNPENQESASAADAPKKDAEEKQRLMN